MYNSQEGHTTDYCKVCVVSTTLGHIISVLHPCLCRRWRHDCLFPCVLGGLLQELVRASGTRSVGNRVRVDSPLRRKQGKRKHTLCSFATAVNGDKKNHILTFQRSCVPGLLSRCVVRASPATSAHTGGATLHCILRIVSYCL